MRLVNAETVDLENFPHGKVPKYTILSHTWGDEEITLQEFVERREATQKLQGLLKIQKACQMSLERGIKYLWVDTCCIDKTHSAELSEAINSMFRWYEEAECCFAYLADVLPNRHDQLITSRWFTRGWTLQELIAPREFEFFASDWSFISTRQELVIQVSTITGIEKQYLERPAQVSCRDLLDKASAAEKMSWASKRITTKEEDMAYCLLGIFGVNMPLIYGEGRKAFKRLQKEILQNSFDPSILVWNPIHRGKTMKFVKPESYRPFLLTLKLFTSLTHPWCAGRGTWAMASAFGALAPSPACFIHCGNVVTGDTAGGWAITSGGLKITLAVSEDKDPYAILPCRLRHDPWSLLAIPLAHHSAKSYLRCDDPVKLVNYRFWHIWAQQKLLVKTTEQVGYSPLEKSRCGLWVQKLPPYIKFLGANLSDGSFQSGGLIRVRSTPSEPKLHYQERVALLFQDQVSNQRFHILIKVCEPSKIPQLHATSTVLLWIARSQFSTMASQKLDCRFVKPTSEEKIRHLLAKTSDMHQLPKYLEYENNLLRIKVPSDHLPDLPLFKLHLEYPSRWLSPILRFEHTITARFWKRFNKLMEGVIFQIFIILMQGGVLNFARGYIELKVIAVLVNLLEKHFSIYVLCEAHLSTFFNKQDPIEWLRATWIVTNEVAMKIACVFQLLPLVSYFAPRISHCLRTSQWSIAICLGLLLRLLFPSRFVVITILIVCWLYIKRGAAGGQKWAVHLGFVRYRYGKGDKVWGLEVSHSDVESDTEPEGNNAIDYP